jgi:hypothetical protein
LNRNVILTSRRKQSNQTKRYSIARYFAPAARKQISPAPKIATPARDHQPTRRKTVMVTTGSGTCQAPTGPTLSAPLVGRLDSGLDPTRQRPVVQVAVLVLATGKVKQTVVSHLARNERTRGAESASALATAQMIRAPASAAVTRRRQPKPRTPLPLCDAPTPHTRTRYTCSRWMTRLPFSAGHLMSKSTCGSPAFAFRTSRRRRERGQSRMDFLSRRVPRLLPVVVSV